ncbi:MAG: cold shock domain-containing protein [Caldithrix sp.]|nr:cold shock domain-containing protein [Caldithrix sp.]
MQTGSIKTWNSQKGFGFIETDDDELFVNINDLHPSFSGKQPIEGQRVKFDVRSDMKGDRAVNVRPA